MCATPLVWPKIIANHTSRSIATPFGKEIHVTKDSRQDNSYDLSLLRGTMA